LTENFISFLWVVSALAAGFLLHAIFFHLFGKFFAREEGGTGKLLLGRCRSSLRLIFPLLILQIVTPSLNFSPQVVLVLKRILAFSLIAAFAWFLSCLLLALRDILLSRYDMRVRDNLKARAVYTQVQVLSRIGIAVIVVVASASALMVFDNLRHLGTSILASAGVVGIVVGFAAQKSISTILAGLQLALTQPIRIDDVVIVEGEWGRVEEITLTYVVIRIWDLRRLVVPTGYFLERPFQNWTRVSADLLGTVVFYADYAVSVEAVREELDRILRGSKLWDGKVWNLQVTNLSDRTVELRALMSAVDASIAWDLRCEVREKLLDFLTKNYPESLPRFRAELNEGTKISNHPLTERHS